MAKIDDLRDLLHFNIKSLDNFYNKGGNFSDGAELEIPE